MSNGEHVEGTPPNGVNAEPFVYRVKPESEALKTTVIVITVSLAFAVMMFLVWVYNLLMSIHIVI